MVSYIPIVDVGKIINKCIYIYIYLYCTYSGNTGQFLCTKFGRKQFVVSTQYDKMKMARKKMARKT